MTDPTPATVVGKVKDERSVREALSALSAAHMAYAEGYADAQNMDTRYFLYNLKGNIEDAERRFVDALIAYAKIPGDAAGWGQG